MSHQHQQPQNIQQHQQQQQSIWSEFGPPTINKPPINFTAQFDNINVEQMKLREQIQQSEKNLSAQHQVNGSLNRILLHVSI